MKVRFALIGCGKVTERLALPQLAGCRDAQVTALIDKDTSKARRLAARFGIDRRLIWTDWGRMLRQAEVDAVSVNLPNALHAEVTIAALKAKKHVMVEKPMALSLAEADAMIAASRANRRLLMVEHSQRFSPAHEVAHDLLRRGRLGAVSRVRGYLGHAGPQYWSGVSRSWFTDPRQAGGGVLFDVGIHIADLLRWLSGKQVGRVFCQTKTLKRRSPVEDNATALLEFTDGAVGSFEVSWTAQPYDVTTHFYGERGQLHTAFQSRQPVVLRYCRSTGDPNVPRGKDLHPVVPASSRVGGAYPSFANSIRRGEALAVPAEEGRRTLEVILAAYHSARTGRWVRLPLGVHAARSGR